MSNLSRINKIACSVMFLTLAAQVFAGPGQNFLKFSDFVTLQEQTEDYKILKLELGVTPQDVDINSDIKINLDTARLLELKTLTSSSDLRPEHQTVLDAANKLHGVIDHMAEGLKKAKTLSSIQKGSEERTKMAADVQKHFNVSIPVIKNYLELMRSPALSGFDTRGASLDDRVDNASRTGRWVSFLTEEIQWMVQRLEDTGQTIIKESRPIAISFSACKSPCESEAERIHLDHYDNINPGVSYSVDKLNIVISPEQIEKLKVAYSRTKDFSDKLNEMDNSRDQLKEVLNEVLKSRDISLDMSKLKNSANNFQEKVTNLLATDWKKEAESLKKQVVQALNGSITSEQTSQLKGIKASLEALESDINKLEQSGRTIKQLIKSLEPGFEAAAQAGKENPLDGLVAILAQASTIKSTFDAVKDELNNFQSKTGIFGGKLKALKGDLDKLVTSVEGLELDGVVKSELKKFTDDFRSRSISPVADAYEDLKNEINLVVDAIKKIHNDDQSSISQYAESDVEPPDSKLFVPLLNAKNTFLDLGLVKDRKEGDQVILKATMYEGTVKNGQFIPTLELDKEIQRFRMLRFGFYGEYGVGLAYVRSDGKHTTENEETRSFAPQVSWILNYRRWRDANEPAHYKKRWYEYIGYGLHTVALDLDHNNETEIGLGVTLSFVDGLFQIGYGVELSNDEKYVFIATRLFDF